MATTDFFTVEVWTPLGLVRYHVLFVMRLMTREIHFAGIVPVPGETWMFQVARNLTDACDGFLRGTRFLIHDRSTLFTEQFRETLKSAGVEPLRLPARSPNLNAFAERFVRSVKESCVERMIFLGESALRRAVAEFALHYHTERNHQGLDNRIIRPETIPFPRQGAIRYRQRWNAALLLPRSRVKLKLREFSDTARKRTGCFRGTTGKAGNIQPESRLRQKDDAIESLRFPNRARVGHEGRRSGSGDLAQNPPCGVVQLVLELRAVHAARHRGPRNDRLSCRPKRDR